MLQLLAFAATIGTTNLACGTLDTVHGRLERALGGGMPQTYTLRGHERGSQSYGLISSTQLRIARFDGPFQETWTDTESESSHQLWSGFVGRAGAARLSVRRVALDILNGTISKYEPTELRCSRRRGIISPVLLYEPDPDVQLALTVDATSGLPSAAQIRESSGTSLSLSGIKYTTSHSHAVPISWTADRIHFSFDRVASGGPIAPIVLSTQRPGLTHAVSLPLIRNAAQPLSRGIVVTINGHPLRMLLDSGASIVVVNKRRAAALHLHSTVRATFMDATGFEAAEVASADIVVGRVRLRHAPVIVVRRTGPYDGEIGVDLLSLGRVSLARDTIEIRPSISDWNERYLKIDTYDGVPFAEARIGRQRAPVLVDTGAALTALFPARFARDGSRLKTGQRACRIALAANWGYPSPYRMNGVRLGPMVLPVTGCLATVDELFWFRTFSVFGYPLIAQHLGFLDYRAGLILFK